MRMGLREANQQFSKAIKAVKAGHEVVLTERGRPIAVIKAIASTSRVETVIAKMIGDGRLIGPHQPKPIRRRGWKPITIKGQPLSETVREDRDAGW